MLPKRKPIPFRTAGYILTALGFVSLFLGAIGLVVAAALPWATVTFLKVPVSIPGAALGWGGVTAGIGVLCVAQFGFLRRFAWLGLALGLVAAYIGIRAEAETGKTVINSIIKTRLQLAYVNARLAQVSLPEIEPFGSTIKPRDEYIGAGVGYTIWAGGVVASASVLLIAGERLRRTCGYCRHAWSARRGEDISYCTSCGERATNAPLCTECSTPLLRRERFCSVCGTGTSTPKRPVMTT